MKKTTPYNTYYNGCFGGNGNYTFAQQGFQSAAAFGGY